MRLHELSLDVIKMPMRRMHNESRLESWPTLFGLNIGKILLRDAYGNRYLAKQSEFAI
jgi:hypothetical protein